MRGQESLINFESPASGIPNKNKTFERMNLESPLNQSIPDSQAKNQIISKNIREVCFFTSPIEPQYPAAYSMGTPVKGNPNIHTHLDRKVDRIVEFDPRPEMNQTERYQSGAFNSSNNLTQGMTSLQMGLQLDRTKESQSSSE